MLTVHYHILGLSPDCSEGEVRKRYLELVRQYPPETYPERFSRIHEAYENLKSPMDLVPQMLFTLTTNDSIERIITDVLDDVRQERLPTDVLLKMGQE